MFHFLIAVGKRSSLLCFILFLFLCLPWSFSFFSAFQVILCGTFYTTMHSSFTLHFIRLNVLSLPVSLSCVPSACLRKIDTCSCFSQGACASVDTSEIISLDFNSWLVLSSNQTEKELLRMVTDIILLSCLYKNVIMIILKQCCGYKGLLL